jgi:hypothetical protein
VVALFQRMQAARFNCTCPEPEPDAPYWQRPKPCPACDEYWAAHGKLHRALGLPLNEWPAVEYPDAECPYPAGCHAAQDWERRRAARPEAFELYRALQRASHQ